MGGSRVFLDLNPSQLRNLRNWTAEELPDRTQTFVLPVPGQVTEAAAQRALRELIQAHEGLRSRLARDSTGQLAQEVMSAEEAAAQPYSDLVATVERSDGVDEWAPIPVPPDQGALKAVCYLADGQVVAIKLGLSHVFVDALGKQAVARHLRKLLEGGPQNGRPPRQASAFAKGPDDPDVRKNTDYWRETLASAPRSCTYRAMRREEKEQAQTAEVPITQAEAAEIHAACRQLGITPHTGWVAAMSTVVGLLTGCHQQVFKTTYANRVMPADFGAVAQLAQPVFPVIQGNAHDTVRGRIEVTAKGLASTFARSMYDANALLDELNSTETLASAVFQPAFEVNYVPTRDHGEADALYDAATERVRVTSAHIDPYAAKPDLALTIRHLPEPLLLLTARRPVWVERDARSVLEHCLAFLRAVRESPDSKISELPIPVLDSVVGLTRGHRSGVAVDLEMTRALVMSAPGVEFCELDVLDATDGATEIRATLRIQEPRDTDRVLTWIRRQQPWFSGSVVPDEVVF